MQIDWSKYYNRSLIIYCQDTLPISTSFEKTDQEELLFHFSTICFSKFAYLIKKNIGHTPVNKNGIVVISPVINNASVKIIDKNEEIFMYKMNPNDLLIFPDYFEHKLYPEGQFLKYIFPIEGDLSFGNGLNDYEVSIVFSDTYRIKIKANSEEDAINKADLLGIDKFEHLWPENKNNEYDRTTLIRTSLWNKKMYQVKEI